MKQTNAEVTVKFIIKNTGDLEEDMDFFTFEEFIRWLIQEEGLIGLVELGHDEYEILKVEAIAEEIDYHEH